MNKSQTVKLAVLIDADNSSYKEIPLILQEIAKYGIASVKRVYGDWSSENLSAWREVLLPHAITPIQQFAYTKGKDATDMMLIINAMDLLHQGNLDGFCIVSSDSDFTPLASRIRESGLMVYGFGKKKTPQAFINACDKFVYTENLKENNEEFMQTETVNEKEPSSDLINIEESDCELKTDVLTVENSGISIEPIKSTITDNQNRVENINQETQKNIISVNPNQVINVDDRTLQLIYKAIKDTADEDGWSNLSTLGSHLVNLKPDFDTRSYGRAKLSGLLLALDLFDIQQRGSQKYVREKTSFAKFLRIVSEILEEYYGIDKFAGLGMIQHYIERKYSVNVSDYGYNSIEEMLKNIDSKYFEFNHNKTQIKMISPKENGE